jgi:hypothetical protein
MAEYGSRPLQDGLRIETVVSGPSAALRFELRGIVELTIDSLERIGDRVRAL